MTLKTEGMKQIVRPDVLDCCCNLQIKHCCPWRILSL